MEINNVESQTLNFSWVAEEEDRVVGGWFDWEFAGFEDRDDFPYLPDVMDSIHSSLVPTKAFINEKPCVTNHINFIYPCQVYSFETTSQKLKQAFKWNMF